MRYAITMTLTAMLAGCAAAPMPADRMAASEAAIRAADEVGAKGVPTAALYLQFAKEEVVQAKQLVKQGEPGAARFALLRAEADAELALALARANAMRADAERSLEQVRELLRQASDTR